MKLKICVPYLAVIFLFFTTSAFSAVRGGDSEFTGQFDPALVAYTEDTENIIFKPVSKDSLRGAKVSEGEEVYLSANRILNPVGPSLAAVLVEEQDAKPMIFVDINADNSFSDDEKFTLRRQEANDSRLWITTINVPMKGGVFTSCPIFIRYLRDYQTEKMTDNDRLLEQSTQVFARGKVDVKGKKILVQYVYDLEKKKITPQSSWQGIDADENGEIDMDNLSPEAANADDETVVFRVGQTYVSTKKVDVEKNQIVLKENQAKDYKRAELGIGKELPDFSFVDLTGKKHKFSDFRGKYVLLDFWGLWCPACRDEIPYIREAYKRFQGRGLEIVGMNTDKYTPESIKKTLDENGLVWTQAQLGSFVEFAGSQLRIQSFPTTFLISPDGKILSMSREERGEPNLRKQNLLTTLDEILPKK